MTSLADELDMDPAFEDPHMALQRGGGGGDFVMSLEEQEDHLEDALRHHRGQSSSSSSSSPVRQQTRRQARTMASELSDENGGMDHAMHGEGFSLADELGSHAGPSEPGASLADEVNGGLSIDEELSRSHITPQAPLASASTLDDESRARRDQEHYLASSEKLSESIRQTDAFLAKLRKVSGTSTGAAGALPSVSSTNSLASHAAATSFDTLSTTDDTASIEKTAAGIVRQLHEHVHLREGQVRDLQECDRILRRAFEEGGEFLMALTEVDEPDEATDVEVLADEKDPLGITAILDRRHEGGLGPHENDMTLSGDITTGHTLSANVDPAYDYNEGQVDNTVMSHEASTISDTGKQSTTTFQELIRLQQSTSDLILSLGVIHEHSQIAHASMGDATRILRNVRTVLSNWQDEVRQMEQSQSWIAAWESGENALKEGQPFSGSAVQRPKDIRQWTQSEMDKFERILEEAHVKAQQLLKPVQDPVLDRIAASKA